MNYSTCLFVLLSLLWSNNLFAYDIAVENVDGVTIYYNYINDGKELEVTYKYEIDFHDTGKHYFYKGNIVIPEEVTFMNRTRKVTSIDNYAFRQCAELSSVTIPNSVTSIGEYAFTYCIGLTSITIPSNVKFIKEGAFNECNGLESVYIFDLETWLSYDWDYANPLRYASHLYVNGEEIKDLVIPNSIKTIGDCAFYCWKGVKSVAIPNSVTSIGRCAFQHCYELASISISSSVTSIGNSAFEGCKELSSIIIPNGVESIGFCAFSGCTGLSSVTIPNSVTSIGKGAFVNTDITNIISYIENPFPIEGVGSSNKSFSNNTFYNATLIVPKGTLDKYKAIEGWKDFVYIEELSNATEIQSIDFEKEIYDRYSLNGNRLLSPSKGINIIKLKDGTIKKVLIK